MFFIALSVIWVNINHERWHSKNVILHDVVNYYGYLPALFIEQDLSLSFLKQEASPNKIYRYTPNKTPNGNYVFKASMGMALTYLPFFASAHLFAKTFAYEADGFSEPYHFAILCSSLFYFLIGIFYLHKVLKRYFNDVIVLTVIFCLCFATNVFYYLTIAGGLSHIVGFSLMAAFMHYFIKWYEQPKIKYSLILGFILALAVLVRPINGLMVLLFLLYNIQSWEGLRARLKFYTANKFVLVLMAITAFVLVLPQLLYWKFISGQYFFNSYVGEHFFFNHPHVFYGLFSFRKGWLIYTPLMILAVIGLFTLKKQLPAFFIAQLAFVAIYIYVVFSWWCWWYGGSFGQRALIDIYSVLAIPLAVFLNFLKLKSVAKTKWLHLFLIFCLVLNIWQTTQAKYNIIHYDSMTGSNYFRVLFTMTKQDNREMYLQHPDYEKALKGEEEYH